MSTTMTIMTLKKCSVKAFIIMVKTAILLYAQSVELYIILYTCVAASQRLCAGLMPAVRVANMNPSKPWWIENAPLSTPFHTSRAMTSASNTFPKEASSF